MVCALHKILNGFNNIENLNVKEYNMTIENYYVLCKMKNNRFKSVKGNLNEDTLEYDWGRVENINFKQAPATILYAIKQIDKLDNEITEWNSDRSNKTWTVSIEERNTRFIKYAGGEGVIYDYLEIIPFTPSVMINISPDWEAVKCCKSSIHRIKHLKYLIESYMAESQRYDKYSYCIENGSTGTNIHAHVVAHFNPKLVKSLNTHLAKGNHTQQIKKLNNKVKGMEGVIKGNSVQKIFLRTEEIVSDKLDYLVEDLKPEGHKNKSIIKPGRVEVVLFTVKY